MHALAGRQGYVAAGVLPPVMRQIYAMLEKTPGVVTEDLIKWQIWKRLNRKPPVSINSYISTIRTVTGQRVIHHRGVGYTLVAKESAGISVNMPLPSTEPVHALGSTGSFLSKD